MYTSIIIMNRCQNSKIWYKNKRHFLVFPVLVFRTLASLEENDCYGQIFILKIPWLKNPVENLRLLEKKKVELRGQTNENLHIFIITKIVYERIIIKYTINDILLLVVLNFQYGSYIIGFQIFRIFLYQTFHRIFKEFLGCWHVLYFTTSVWTSKCLMAFQRL